jgi:F-type H+-transporting ATPase subunit a
MTIVSRKDQERGGESVESGILGFTQGLHSVMLADSSNKLDFFIYSYTKLHLFGQTLYLTTTTISILIVMIVLLIFGIAARRTIMKADPYAAPGGFQNFVEIVVESLDAMVVSSMGPKLAPKFRNYVSALFLFILTCNLSGLMGLRPPTADYAVTFPLAIITWVMIQFNGFKYQKFGKIKGLFEPIFLFFPINLISEFATPVSMSLRLFGNILSGTVMMGLIYGLLPKFITLFWPGFLHVYLDVFSGCIQTYVFCMLTMCFIANAVGDQA